jgi:hypothetical protein
LESEVFILLQQKILGSLEGMQAAHMNSLFVLSVKRVLRELTAVIISSQP